VSVSPAVTPDVVYSILGVGEESRIAALRNTKPQQIEELQNYYLAIFEPEAISAEAFSVADRALVAVRVASHTGSTAVADWYANIAEREGVEPGTIASARDVSKPWEDETVLGVAIRRADKVTVHPVDTRAEDLQWLKDAGLSPAGILSLSQTIAFVSYQLRLIAGLRALGGI
jgi:uncharacterized protein YciW